MVRGDSMNWNKSKTYRLLVGKAQGERPLIGIGLELGG
jgi:hypothetical protein